MYVILWEYAVRPQKLPSFLNTYGPEGAWARLFRQAEGFLGVELLRADDDGTRFVTLDRWRSRADFQAFRAGFSQVYETLDAELEELTVSETRIGGFETA